jgi:Resolvase, N terminal domain
MLNENEWREVSAMMKLGYARVSTNEQDTAAQVAALKSAGCEKIFRDKASGGRWERPELHRLLDQLRKADVLVVWRLDRLSRSLRDVLMIMERIQEAKASGGVGQSSDPISRTKSLRWYQRAAKLPLMPQDFSMCILRQYRGFWLELVPELYRGSGLMHLCDMPPTAGRQPNQRAEILRMVNSGKTSAAEAARLFGLHRSNISRPISHARAAEVGVGGQIPNSSS